MGCVNQPLERPISDVFRPSVGQTWHNWVFDTFSKTGEANYLYEDCRRIREWYIARYKQTQRAVAKRQINAQNKSHPVYELQDAIWVGSSVHYINYSFELTVHFVHGLYTVVVRHADSMIVVNFYRDKLLQKRPQIESLCYIGPGEMIHVGVSLHDRQAQLAKQPTQYNIQAAQISDVPIFEEGAECSIYMILAAHRNYLHYGTFNLFAFMPLWVALGFVA